MSTFIICWSIFGERQRVWGDHQHCQLAEHQSKNSHNHSFFLSLIQEVGWTVRSHREAQITWDKCAVKFVFTKFTWRCLRILLRNPGRIYFSWWDLPGLTWSPARWKDKILDLPLRVIQLMPHHWLSLYTNIVK